MFGTIVLLAALSAVAWFGVHAALTYKATEGSAWTRLFAATKNSATLFWSAIVSAVTVSVNGMLSMTDFLGAPEVREWVTSHFSAGIASSIMLGVVFLISLARLRSLGK